MPDTRNSLESLPKASPVKTGLDEDGPEPNTPVKTGLDEDGPEPNTPVKTGLDEDGPEP